MRAFISKRLALFLSLLTLVVAFVTGVTGFLNLEGLAIVVGGSIANALLSYERDDVVRAFATIRDMLKKPPNDKDRLHDDIRRLISWAYVLRDNDFIGLEREAADKIKDPFLRYGMDLVVTEYPADKIRSMLHTVSDAEFERRCMPVTVLRNMAATAPAFGMVGTLVGMVMLLQHIGADINNIGSGLAIAMLSTLYGILIARLVCLPAADKLLLQEERDRFRHYMLAEGLALLSERQSPFYMQDKLNSFLEPSRHFSLDNLEKMAFSRRMAMAA